jgi:membrane protein implicated in regulation of membrane protease activity
MDSWMHSPWFWSGMALALFAAEALLPGAFLLWLGFAATATALLVVVLPISLPAQWFLFGLLGLVAMAVGWKLRQRIPPQPTDHPLLNQRGAQLVGQIYALDSAIVDGRGRLKIGDAFWRAEGADLPVGTKVRVVKVDSGVVRVEAV